MRKALKLTFYLLFGLLAGVFIALTAIYFVAKAMLAPLPGEWTTELRTGPLRVQAGVPSLIRLGTAPWFAQVLDGRKLNTAAGPVQLRWHAQSNTLHLRCAPCVLQGGQHGGTLGGSLAGVLGEEALQLDELWVSVQRVGMHLQGELQSGTVHATWKGELQRQQLRLSLDLPSTPMANVYQLFARSVPEVGRARIEGQFALQARLSLPHGSLSVSPQMEGFRVSGLGTQAWANAKPCARASRLHSESWLAKAVLAAEDQRFFEHTGFDMAELTESFARNQRKGHLERGGSTLNQQLAKLLVAGDARSATRKLRELLYAVEMEDTLGKPRILRLYLDNAPWGEGVCGAESAAKKYFGVRARDLSPQQAVWLAAMLHNPELEAQQWQRRGEVNVPRAQRVSMGLPHIARSQRMAIAQSFTQTPWSSASTVAERQAAERLAQAQEPMAAQIPDNTLTTELAQPEQPKAQPIHVEQADVEHADAQAVNIELVQAQQPMRERSAATQATTEQSATLKPASASPPTPDAAQRGYSFGDDRP
jgi:monofunctional glycosyltransferase